MNEKQIIQMVGSGVSPYALISALTVASAHEKSKLTEKEKVEREEKQRLSAEESIRQAKIIKNICPCCDGRLSRGKKNKGNNYKRLWTCKSCGRSHTV